MTHYGTRKQLDRVLRVKNAPFSTDYVDRTLSLGKRTTRYDFPVNGSRVHAYIEGDHVIAVLLSSFDAETGSMYRWKF